MGKLAVAVLELEDQLRKLSNTAGIIATIKYDDLNEMKDLASRMGLHLFQPFEISTYQNNYQFCYHIPNSELKIQVVSTTEFRMEKKLVEI